jgi:hypothetical protein
MAILAANQTITGWKPIVFGRADARRDVMRRRGY